MHDPLLDLNHDSRAGGLHHESARTKEEDLLASELMIEGSVVNEP